MSYFNYSFKKMMILDDVNGKFKSKAAWDGTTASLEVANGILKTADVNSVQLNACGKGVLGFFNPETMKSLNLTNLSNISAWSKKPFVIANSTFMKHDKIGKFHGGYQETNKSKMINPRYINKVWYVKPSELLNTELMIGEDLENTPTTTEYLYEGYSDGQKRSFKTGKTYYLRVDIKGTPASMFARHDLYHVFDANGGCESYCEDGTPAPANTWEIFRQWIEGIDNEETFKGFVLPVLVMEDAAHKLYFFMNKKYFGEYGITPNTDYTQLTENAVYDIEDFESVMDGASIQESAYCESCTSDPTYKFNIALIGAYVDTRFGTCTFSKFDYYGVEPIQLYACEVQFNGETCDAERVSVRRNRRGIVGTGYGEEVIRDLILTEGYRQNYWSEDKRIREISDGDDVFDAINKDAKYGSFYVLHSVPRHNNDSGIFDNDQYTVRIVFNENSGALDDLKSIFQDIIDDNNLGITIEDFTRMKDSNGVVDGELNTIFPTEVIGVLEDGNGNPAAIDSDDREDPQEIVPEEEPHHFITVTVGEHGTVTPNGKVKVYDGDNASFTITPATGYVVDTATLDGNDVSGQIVDGVLTISNVTADHALEVTFKTE